ncbi:TIGR04086 family membrane protein [Gorillibacterium massiliense]|uniref:TIGR04086 family membrane protein n=1 Tax=Gorillibacterium massiliense TaxID=1280390 RepID=UPI0004BB731F|nr:TIGR04086 family membrane protein [Gorillibacterium massiliense]
MDMNVSDKIRIVPSVLKGTLYAFIVLALCALVFSLLLVLTNQSEDSLKRSAYAIHALAALIGGFAAGRKSGAKGWSAGGITGLIYSIILYLAAFLGADRDLNLQLLFFAAGAFVAGALGGMLGVNTKKN